MPAKKSRKGAAKSGPVRRPDPVLPDEVWANVFNQAAPMSLFWLKQVSKKFRTLVRDDVRKRWNRWRSKAARPLTLSRISAKRGDELDDLLFRKICSGKEAITFSKFKTDDRSWLDLRVKFLGQDISSSTASAAGGKRKVLTVSITPDFDFADVVTNAPPSLQEVKKQVKKREEEAAKKEVWRRYCENCDMELDTTEALWDYRSKVFMCEDCADELGGDLVPVEDEFESWD